jgi:chromosome segregation ATPase
MKLGQFFHHLRRKAESGLDKLISAETRVNTVLADTMDALNKQADNAKKLQASRLEFNDNLEKIRKETTRFKTQCEVLKNKGVKAEDEEFQIAGTQYLEHKKMLEDLEAQQKEIDKTWERVQKALKQLNLNKSLLTAKAEMLKTKINMYKVMENITDSGLVDINNTFAEIDGMVSKMQYQNEASRAVDDIVNGRDTSKSMQVAEVDDLFNSL